MERKILCEGFSADDPKRVWIADNDELATAFEKVKTPLADFKLQSGSSNPCLDVAHCPADDTVALDGLCFEYLEEPALRIVNG